MATASIQERFDAFRVECVREWHRKAAEYPTPVVWRSCRKAALEEAPAFFGLVFRNPAARLKTRPSRFSLPFEMTKLTGAGLIGGYGD